MGSELDNVMEFEDIADNERMHRLKPVSCTMNKGDK